MATDEIKLNQHKLYDVYLHYLFISKRWARKGDMTQSVIASECAHSAVLKRSKSVLICSKTESRQRSGRNSLFSLVCAKSSTKRLHCCRKRNIKKQEKNKKDRVSAISLFSFSTKLLLLAANEPPARRIVRLTREALFPSLPLAGLVLAAGRFDEVFNTCQLTGTYAVPEEVELGIVLFVLIQFLFKCGKLLLFALLLAVCEQGFHSLHEPQESKLCNLGVIERALLLKNLIFGIRVNAEYGRREDCVPATVIRFVGDDAVMEFRVHLIRSFQKQKEIKKHLLLILLST